MKPVVPTCRDDDPLSAAIVTLATLHTGAIGIQDTTFAAIGVISKTDLVLACLLGEIPESQARRAISTPIRSVQADGRLSSTLQ